MDLTSHARALRSRMTDAERHLWSKLRRHALGHRIRRQAPIGPYIVDFVCHAAKLVVEVDGGQHANEAQCRHDTQRTAWLATRGYRVLRFWNNEVFEHLPGVLETIAVALKAQASHKPPTPIPSPQGGGESLAERPRERHCAQRAEAKNVSSNRAVHDSPQGIGVGGGC